MIVKSATGPVDLGNPENIRAGMVFWSANYDMSHAGDRRFVVGRRDGDCWRDARDDSLGTNLRGAQRFEGCDPAVATRADCERFGLAPGIDAGAAGFARTRDGFAEDVHFMRGCGVVWERFGDRGSRRVDPEAVAPGIDYFIGLDMRHARPEDVERLCCGEKHYEPYRDGTTRGVVRTCTLAIGDHAEHEDIAAGVKWAAGITATSFKASVTMSAEDFNKATDAMFDRAAAWAASAPPLTAKGCMGVADKVWSPGKASGLCPHCKTGHMERRTSRFHGGYMACIGGCGRTGDVYDPAAFAPKKETGQGCPNTPAVHVAVRVGGPSVVGTASRDLHYMLRASDIPGGEAPRVVATQEEADRVFGKGSWMADNVGYMLRSGPVYLDSGKCDASRVQQPERSASGKTVPALCACGSHGAVLATSGVAGGGKGSAAVASGGTPIYSISGVVGFAAASGGNGKPGAAQGGGGKPYTWADASGIVSAADLNAIHGWTAEQAPVGAITLNVGALKPGTTVVLRTPGGDPINLTPQAAALRAALPTIDALPWPAADKRALRDAAHAVCEIVEATDGKAPAALRGPVTEMLAALATAAHVGPAVIGEATKARDAARAAMPRRAK